MIDFDMLWNLWKHEKQYFPKDFKGVMLAASGHIDSTALFAIFCEFTKVEKNFFKGLIHVNYKLRGPDSDNDQKLICEFAKARNLSYEALELDSLNEMPATGISFQDWARTKRFEFFSEFTKKGYVVALAHQADDLAENVLFRMIRGSEPEHLLGMDRYSSGIWRPILHLSRQDLLGFLQSTQTPYREDRSNSELNYSRNRIRHVVLKELESIHSGATSKIIRHGTESIELSRYIQKTLAVHLTVDHGFPVSIAKELPFAAFKQLISLLLSMNGASSPMLHSEHVRLFYNELQIGPRKRFNLTPDWDLVTTSELIRVQQKAFKIEAHPSLTRAMHTQQYSVLLAADHTAIWNKDKITKWQISNHLRLPLKIKVSVANLREKVKIDGCTVRWQIKDLIHRNRDLLDKADILYIISAGDSVFLFDGQFFVCPDQDGILVKTEVNDISIDIKSLPELD